MESHRRGTAAVFGGTGPACGPGQLVGFHHWLQLQLFTGAGRPYAHHRAWLDGLPPLLCSTFSFQRSRSRAHLFLGIPMLCFRMQCGAVFQRLSEHSLPTLFSRLILLLGAIICQCAVSTSQPVSLPPLPPTHPISIRPRPPLAWKHKLHLVPSWVDHQAGRTGRQLTVCMLALRAWMVQWVGHVLARPRQQRTVHVFEWLPG